MFIANNEIEMYGHDFKAKINVLKANLLTGQIKIKNNLYNRFMERLFFFQTRS